MLRPRGRITTKLKSMSLATLKIVKMISPSLILSDKTVQAFMVCMNHLTLPDAAQAILILIPLKQKMLVALVVMELKHLRELMCLFSHLLAKPMSKIQLLISKFSMAS